MLRVELQQITWFAADHPAVVRVLGSNGA